MNIWKNISVRRTTWISWSMSHLRTWRRWGLWPILQSTTRGQERCFTCGSCHVVCGLDGENKKRLNSTTGAEQRNETSKTLSVFVLVFEFVFDFLLQWRILLFFFKSSCVIITDDGKHNFSKIVESTFSWKKRFPVKSVWLRWSFTCFDVMALTSGWSGLNPAAPHGPSYFEAFRGDACFPVSHAACFIADSKTF